MDDIQPRKACRLLARRWFYASQRFLLRQKEDRLPLLYCKMHRNLALRGSVKGCQRMLAKVWFAVFVLWHWKGALAWTVTDITLVRSPRSSNLALEAKRNKRAQSRQDEADLNRWYESVDADASPDDVFWEEMERQRLLSKSGGSVDDMNGMSGGPGYSASMSTGGSAGVRMNQGISEQTLAKTNSLIAMAAMNGQTQKSTEATLSEYASFAVSDNWLDEELVWMMQQDDELEDDDNDHVPSLDEQLDAWEALEDGDDYEDDDEKETTDDDNEWMSSDDPWDHFGKTENDEESARLPVDPRSPANAYLFDEESVADLYDPETLERLSKISCSSRRLERARNSPKAKAFFEQGPDRKEGYEQFWVSAVDNACWRNLKGSFRNFGIQFADNFGDWKDESLEDSLATIEDVASYKARQVYNVTGLPCIASRTSFEVEPVPDLNTGGSVSAGGRAAVANANPRVAMGYRFNDVGTHVDYICDALRPLSQPDRVTRFRTCLCYFDGEMEVFDYGVCDVDLLYANSLRTFIPVSQAINEMMRTLELSFGLDHQRWIKGRVDEGMSGLGTAGVKLRDMVLKEGKVLPNDIIDVSAFMDSKVDVNLMDECGKELSERAMHLKPSKILTVATTGLVIALPMAKYLQVPVVYARKERNVVMADTFKAGYSSKTVGKNRELLVSKSHIDDDDRILIVDDFLSGGSSQEALLRIVSDAGAVAVGVSVLLEKVYDSGRQSLSGFNVPIHSLCRIASVKGGVIQLLEEDGFDRTTAIPDHSVKME
jgi:xanthine phosphoribosyltransferase